MTAVIKKKVLLVDDDKMYVLALKRHLERQGMNVLVCNSTRKALELDYRHLSAAVLDVYVDGDMDGLELLSRLRLSAPSLPAIMITGMNSDLVYGAARRAGADVLLSKPFRLARLAGLIETSIETPLAGRISEYKGEILIAHGGERGRLLSSLLTTEGYRTFLAATQTEAISELEERPCLRGVLLQESLPGGASLVSRRAEGLGLFRHILVLVENAGGGPSVPEHWLPRGGLRLELPASPADISRSVSAVLSPDPRRCYREAA